MAQNAPPVHSWFDLNKDGTMVAGAHHVRSVIGNKLLEVWPEYGPTTQPHLDAAWENGKEQWTSMFRGTPYTCTAVRKDGLLRVNCHMAPDIDADLDQLITSTILLLGQLHERLEAGASATSRQSTQHDPGEDRSPSPNTSGSPRALRLVD